MNTLEVGTRGGLSSLSSTRRYIVPALLFASSSALMSKVPLEPSLGLTRDAIEHAASAYFEGLNRGEIGNWYQPLNAAGSGMDSAVFSFYLDDARTKVKIEEFRIRAYRDLAPTWNPYGAAAPNDTSTENAVASLNILWKVGVLPFKISPSYEEGIVFELRRGDNFFILEFYNEGDIIFLQRTGSEESRVKEIDLAEMEAVAQEIAAF